MTLDEEMAFYKETRFTPGQEVVAAHSFYPYLTGGKTYTVKEFIEPVRVDGFRFPAYVVVARDSGKSGIFHTHRFIAKE